MLVVRGTGRREQDRQNTSRRKAAAIAVLTRKASSRPQPQKSRLPAQGPTAVQREVADSLGSVTGLPPVS